MNELQLNQPGRFNSCTPFDNHTADLNNAIVYQSENTFTQQTDLSLEFAAEPRSPRRCQRPGNPRNGKVSSSPNAKRLFSNGEFVSYTCNHGYYLIGAFRVFCFQGKWSSDAPTCDAGRQNEEQKAA